MQECFRTQYYLNHWRKDCSPPGALWTLITANNCPAILGMAYLLMPQLMKSYAGLLDKRKEHFNYHLRSCRIVVKCACGHQKGRCHCLWNRLEAVGKKSSINYNCMLHFAQYLREQRRSLTDWWETEVQTLAWRFKQPVRHPTEDINSQGMLSGMPTVGMLSLMPEHVSPWEERRQTLQALGYHVEVVKV